MSTRDQSQHMAVALYRCINRSNRLLCMCTCTYYTYNYVTLSLGFGYIVSGLFIFFLFIYIFDCVIECIYQKGVNSFSQCLMETKYGKRLTNVLDILSIWPPMEPRCSIWLLLSFKCLGQWYISLNIQLPLILRLIGESLQSF